MHRDAPGSDPLLPMSSENEQHRQHVANQPAPRPPGAHALHLAPQYLQQPSCGPYPNNLHAYDAPAGSAAGSKTATPLAELSFAQGAALPDNIGLAADDLQDPYVLSPVDPRELQMCTPMGMPSHEGVSDSILPAAPPWIVWSTEVADDSTGLSFPDSEATAAEDAIPLAFQHDHSRSTDVAVFTQWTAGIFAQAKDTLGAFAELARASGPKTSPHTFRPGSFEWAKQIEDGSWSLKCCSGICETIKVFMKLGPGMKGDYMPLAFADTPHCAYDIYTESRDTVPLKSIAA